MKKTVLGVGQAQVRKAPSTETVPALVVAAYAYLLLAGSAESVAQTCLPKPKWHSPNLTARVSTQQMLSLFRSGLWKTAINTNVTRFVDGKSTERTLFYSKESLAAAIVYAYK